MKEYKADVSVGMSVRMFQIEDRWTDFDEIWYRHYAMLNHPNNVTFRFMRWVTSTYRTREIVRWERH